MRTELDHQLELLHAALADHASLALAALSDGVSMVDGRTPHQLRPPTGLDERITERCRSIEHDVEVLLARQAPVCSDLRRVMALLRINHHLERIGHHAVRIAYATLERHAVPDTAQTTALLTAMANRALDMTAQAVHALAVGDHDAADALRELDAELDAHEATVAESALGEFHDSQGGAERVRWALHAARRLERIGDHAVGIGLRVRDLPIPIGSASSYDG
jgi:phosphate transport system protein